MNFFCLIILWVFKIKGLAPSNNNQNHLAALVDIHSILYIEAKSLFQPEFISWGRSWRIPLRQKPTSRWRGSVQTNLNRRISSSTASFRSAQFLKTCNVLNMNYGHWYRRGIGIDSTSRYDLVDRCHGKETWAWYLTLTIQSRLDLDLTLSHPILHSAR